MNKWRGLVVGHQAILLGLVFNTRTMTVGTTDEYRAEILQMLKDNWVGATHFTISNLVKLSGKLARLGEGAPWVFHLMTHIFASVAYALRQNGVFLQNESRSFCKIINEIKMLRRLPTVDLDVQHMNFFIRKVAKAKFKCATHYLIPPSLWHEIDLLVRWLDPSSGIRWYSPIAHLIRRMPYATSAGDASLRAGGGFCFKLRFWWHIEWPQKIIQKTKLFLEDDSRGDFISINVLEFIVININMAAAITALLLDGHDDDPYPVLLNLCDNISSTRWCNHHCRGSMKAKALGRLFCGLLVNSFLGINSKWISTESNVLADEISRLQKIATDPVSGDSSYDYSQLQANFPQLRHCRFFHPSRKLLSLIWHTVLTAQLPDPTEILQLRQDGLGRLTT